MTELGPFLSRHAPRSSETVKVDYPSPQNAVLDVSLESAGLVVLADVYYPGWELTIDGKPAPIYRVNHLMRRRGRRVRLTSPGLYLRTKILPGRPSPFDSGAGRLGFGWTRLSPETCRSRARHSGSAHCRRRRRTFLISSSCFRERSPMRKNRRLLAFVLAGGSVVSRRHGSVGKTTQGRSRAERAGLGGCPARALQPVDVRRPS